MKEVAQIKTERHSLKHAQRALQALRVEMFAKRVKVGLGFQEMQERMESGELHLSDAEGAEYFKRLDEQVQADDESKQAG
jgi:hypothetical protein